MSSEKTDAKEKKNPWIWVEDALILLAIPVLWLTIFQLKGPIYTAIQWITLAVMVWIFINRVRRFHRYAEEHKKKPPTPFP